VREEDGFTIIELLVVLVVIAVLIAAAIGFQAGARERAADAAARSNIRTAVPAIEAYRADQGSYAGMTVASLQTAYSPGVQGIAIVSTSSDAYCVSATASGATWYKVGPDGPITRSACS
jgi:type IV pilus assembly protein PilA